MSHMLFGYGILGDRLVSGQVYGWSEVGFRPGNRSSGQSISTHSKESMAICHCIFMERSLRRKGVLHFIFCIQRTIVVVLGCGHFCRAEVCSWRLSWGGLSGGPGLFLVDRSSLAARVCSGAMGSGGEGGRINADKKFSSGTIHKG